MEGRGFEPPHLRWVRGYFEVWTKFAVCTQRCITYLPFMEAIFVIHGIGGYDVGLQAFLEKNHPNFYPTFFCKYPTHLITNQDPAFNCLHITYKCFIIINNPVLQTLHIPFFKECLLLIKIDIIFYPHLNKVLYLKLNNYTDLPSFSIK